MYCKFCGKELNDNALFCNNCGARLSNDNNQTLGISTDSVVSAPQDEPSSSDGIADLVNDNNVKKEKQALPMIGFMEAISKCFSNYATFSGRARRSEFWYFYLGSTLILLGATLVFGLIGAAVHSKGQVEGVLLIIVYLLTFMPYWAVMVRRLHDTGKSGWYFWLNLIPYIGALVLLIILSQDSEQDENKYGPSPKYVEK